MCLLCIIMSRQERSKMQQPKKKKSFRPAPETVQREYDGKWVRWEWKYDTELGLVHPSVAKRWDYLHSRGRWVITAVMDNVKPKDSWDIVE